ncbi:hypothetical protein ACGFZA_36215 [Streptomyces sp. NPDC048211]|uniref:hypothetical protein n=1 Tax=Streptomyces sp. NPDC048211 TaxID=3365516 RepID=UPI0037193C70
MVLQQISVPHVGTYNFGVGVDRLSGTAMNLVVNPTTATPTDASGSSQSFEVSRVTSTHDLLEKLGVDVKASYGCAAFGAGISARFSFAQSSEVHSASLFMAITATIHLADLSIPECALTAPAAAMVDRPDVFVQRYGDMFARSCRRGGLFVGLIRVETFDDTESTAIEAELGGSYGFFSGEAATKFTKVTQDHKVNVYCKMHSEGGPALQLTDPADPAGLLNVANTWMQAMHDDPSKYSQPYEWTLAPISITEGPTPPNQEQIANAQEILKFCAEERTALLDQYNLLNWWVKHPDRYDWTGATPPAEVATAASGTQKDLDTVAACASQAIEHPASAKRPASYAAEIGTVYPAGLMPATPPAPRPGPATVYDQVSFAGHSQTLAPGKYDNASGNITIGNDAIRSVQLPAGMVMRLYEHFHFQGQFIDIRETTADLNQWAAKASSLAIYRDGEEPPRTTEVILIQLPNLDTWDGPFWVFSAADGVQSAPTMAVRSAHIPEGMVLTLFAGPGFTGAAVDFTQDTAELGERAPGTYSFAVWDRVSGERPVLPPA